MEQYNGSNKNALVEQTLIKELKEPQNKARQALWQEGAKDKLLLKDIEDVEVAFRTADAETFSRVDL